MVSELGCGIFFLVIKSTPIPLSCTLASKHKQWSQTYVQPAIPRFDGHYDHWSMLIENFLRSKEYWTDVEAGVNESTTGVVLSEADQKKLEERKLKDIFSKPLIVSS